MLVGVITDTHDDLDKVDEGVRIFEERGVDRVLHLGDWTSPFTIFRMEGLPLHGVLGNNDGDIPHLTEVMDKLGGTFHGNVYAFTEDEMAICAIHGEHPPIVEALACSGLYDIILRGHTHRVEDRTVNTHTPAGEARTVRVINPGWDHVVLLDTVTRSAQWVRILPPEGAWDGVPFRLGSKHALPK
jgi:uncharacterized protein